MPAEEYLEPHPADQFYELDLRAYKGVVVESLVLPIVPLDHPTSCLQASAIQISCLSPLSYVGCEVSKDSATPTEEALN